MFGTNLSNELQPSTYTFGGGNYKIHFHDTQPTDPTCGIHISLDDLLLHQVCFYTKALAA